MKKEKLKELQDELKTQDNLATSHPLFCVFEKEIIYGIDSDYSDKFIYVDENGEEAEQDEPADDLRMVHYIKRDRFINAHLTDKAARLYIEQNKHNMEQPFVYVISLNRCHEMIAIQEYFKTLRLEV